MSFSDLLLHFALGLGASFLGALPLGIVNLSVVNLTVNRSFKAGFQVSIGASIIEVIQFLLALYVGVMVVDYMETHPFVKVLVFLLFVGLGLVFLFRKQAQQTQVYRRHLPYVVRGIFLAMINPQALPFWVFVIAGLQSAHWVTLDPAGQANLVLFFLLGVWTGKLLALLLFGALSVVIVKRVARISTMMNKIIGVVLLAIAVYQGVSLLVAS